MEKTEHITADAALGAMILGAGAYYLAAAYPAAAPFVWLYALCLTALTRLPAGRGAFYAGFGLGLATFVPQLRFFWDIFGPAALALWSVLAFWIGLFIWLSCRCRQRFGRVKAGLLIPLIWLGVEYFRGELYHLRFSWAAIGSVLSGSGLDGALPLVGMYGFGLALMALASLLALLPFKLSACFGAFILMLLAAVAQGPRASRNAERRKTIKIVGAQLEFPGLVETRHALNRLIDAHPDLDLAVLPEYALDGPPPDAIRDWCRLNRKHLIIGGKDPAGADAYRNTAFVIGPEGEIVFRQAKSAPIPFFDDGLPAAERRVWASPWGRIGIGVCYDLSFTRIIDDFIRQGAQLLIIPTMDVEAWGRFEHEQHARVAPIRAAECRVPVFRVASSGISQSVDATGHVRATAPYPGPGEWIVDRVALSEPGRLPLDRRVGPAASLGTGALWAWLVVSGRRRSSRTAAA